jgi:hypothetical protein
LIAVKNWSVMASDSTTSIPKYIRFMHIRITQVYYTRVYATAPFLSFHLHMKLGDRDPLSIVCINGCKLWWRSGKYRKPNLKQKLSKIACDILADADLSVWPCAALPSPSHMPPPEIAKRQAP